MDNNNNNNGVPQPGQAPPAGTIVDPQQQQQMQPPAQQIQYIPMTNQYQAGGNAGSGKFFDGITLTDIIIGTLTIGALTLALLYYRKKMKLAKVEYTELRSEVDLVKKELEDMKAPATVRTEFG